MYANIAVVQSLSRVHSSETPWTKVQAPLSMGFPR